MGCNQNPETPTTKEENRKKIEMVTNYGTMIIELYNETPLHRDNFINLANHHAYDSLLFHRVINKFMIQGGDPDSRQAQAGDTLGEGDAPYVVEAEFDARLFHKKGALAAAREDHPQKASSAMQFYIVQGKVFNDSLLERSEKRTTRNKAKDYFENDSDKKSLLDSIESAMDRRDMERYNLFMDSIASLAKMDVNFKPFTIPDALREVYKTNGGTPHLDQNYTVFGEVVNGIEVLDSIANVQTGILYRPLEDVRIQTVRVLD